jgi:hypothetical protein
MALMPNRSTSVPHKLFGLWVRARREALPRFKNKDIGREVHTTINANFYLRVHI